MLIAREREPAKPRHCRVRSVKSWGPPGSLSRPVALVTRRRADSPPPQLISDESWP